MFHHNCNSVNSYYHHSGVTTTVVSLQWCHHHDSGVYYSGVTITTVPPLWSALMVIIMVNINVWSLCLVSIYCVIFLFAYFLSVTLMNNFHVQCFKVAFMVSIHVLLIFCFGWILWSIFFFILLTKVLLSLVVPGHARKQLKCSQYNIDE